MIFPSGESTVSTLHPVNFSGAPHSSCSRCAVDAVMTEFQDLVTSEMPSTLAAVPVKTKYVSVSSPNCSLKTERALLV